MAEPVMSDAQRAFVNRERAGTMATTAPDGRPRLVPICFVVAPEPDDLGRALIYSPIDEKPKKSPSPRDLARVRDILVLPEVSVLVDHWDEDWSKLGWLRAYGVGWMLEPEPHEREEHAAAVKQLREKYPQYRDQDLDNRPIIRVAVDRIVTWGAVD